MINDLLSPTEVYTTTLVNKKPAKVWDMAWAEGVVEVDRRDQEFLVIRKDFLREKLKALTSGTPQSLEEMLVGYDADQAKAEMGDWLDAEPVGKEIV